MDILLREVTGRSGGIRTYRDTVLEGNSHSLGSGPDQAIQLIGIGVLPEHAQVRAAGGKLNVQCRRAATVNVNGKPMTSATVGPDDRLELAGHEILVIEAPAGFDLALQLTPNPNIDSSAYEAAFRTDLDQTWLSRRMPSWALLILVLVLSLVLPLGYVLTPDRVELQVPPDTLWTTGPLHPAHQLAIGNDCSACHTELFQRVTDNDCRVCHDVLADHIPEMRATELGLPHVRCATCHREHNEPEYLVVQADDQCTDCHAHPEAFSSAIAVSAVRGFSEDDHPAFKARLLQPVATESGTGLSFTWRHHIESVAGAREASNLKFPHDIHLDEVKVRNPNDNSPISCGDCHQLSEDGEHFRPIAMQVHCSSCHELTFDVTAPDRQLPHGSPREVAFAIEGFFARRFLNPGQDEESSTRRRRPGRSDAPQRCDLGPKACTELRTLQEVTNQFTVRGCVTCHEVTDSEGSDLYSRFQVHPVRLVRDYFESAKFDHQSHLTQKDKTGDEACLSCHLADASQTSADLLIPDLDNCTSCHGDPTVPDVVVLQCVGCHEFHPSLSRYTGHSIDEAPGGMRQ